MAVQTGTLILRPVASKGTTAVTMPVDTPVEDYWKLVNEETPDAGATYVTISNYPLSINYYLLQLPDGVLLKSISTIKYLYNYTSGGATGTFENSEMWQLIDYETESVILSYTGASFKSVTDWMDNEYYWYEENEDTDSWNTVVGCFNSGNLGICHRYVEEAGNADKERHHNITQCYLEIECTYEIIEPSATTVYIRENNIWEPIAGTIYYKENGSWAQSSIDILAEGDKFNLNIIT